MQLFSKLFLAWLLYFIASTVATLGSKFLFYGIYQGVAFRKLSEPDEGSGTRGRTLVLFILRSTVDR